MVATDLLRPLRVYAWGQPLPPEIRELVDPDDPAVDFIIDEFATMRATGFDVTDPDIIALTVQTARVKAGKLRADIESGAFARRQAEWATPSTDGIELPGWCSRPGVVYYARLGNRCKIGWTNNFTQRMRSITPEEVLVTEPGGRVTEAERHAQFDALRTSGEWFKYEGSLVEHVARLRENVTRG